MKYKGGWSDENYKKYLSNIYKPLIDSYNPHIRKNIIKFIEIEKILNNHIEIHIIDKLNNDIEKNRNNKSSNTHSKMNLNELVSYIRDNIDYFKDILIDNYDYTFPKITIVPKNKIFKRRQNIQKFNKNKESWLDYTSSYKKIFPYKYFK